MLLVSKTPEHFPQSRLPHNECGPYQVQAALRKAESAPPLETLYATQIHRKVDVTTPWNIKRVLRRHGAYSRLQFLTRKTFSARLQSALSDDHPVLFIIHSIQGQGGLHWISAWGYDPTTDEFLCYDSQMPSSSSTHGNVRYTAQVLKNALPWIGTFSVTLHQ